MNTLQSYFASIFMLAASCVLVLLVVASCDLQLAHADGFAAAFAPAYQVLQ